MMPFTRNIRYEGQSSPKTILKMDIICKNCHLDKAGVRTTYSFSIGEDNEYERRNIGPYALRQREEGQNLTPEGRRLSQKF